MTKSEANKPSRKNVALIFLGLLAVGFALIGSFVGSATAINVDAYRWAAKVAISLFIGCWLLSILIFLKSRWLGKILALLIALLPISVFLDILRR